MQRLGRLSCGCSGCCCCCYCWSPSSTLHIHSIYRSQTTTPDSCAIFRTLACRFIVMENHFHFTVTDSLAVNAPDDQRTDGRCLRSCCGGAVDTASCTQEEEEECHRTDYKRKREAQSESTQLLFLPRRRRRALSWSSVRGIRA